MDKQNYIIAKSVHETLELDRIEFMTKLGKKAPKQDLTARSLNGEFKFDRARAYIMGGMDKKITHLFKCDNNYGGCCFMPGIHSSDISKALGYFADFKVDFIGIARVGQFYTSYFDSVGDGIWDLNDKCPSYMLLSLGRNGMELSRMKNRNLTKAKMEIADE